MIKKLLAEIFFTLLAGKVLLFDDAELPDS